ncbi:MAG: hypothetical protein OXI63_11595 [Candidatus Poribacteria bacterium]|nr:hypothetical protein [Candidatus Poribacteria bacterium]
MDFKIVTRFDPLTTETIRAHPVIDAGVPIQLMVHRPKNGTGWMVSEWTTGQRIDLPSRATSREMAVMMVVQKIQTLPPGKLEALLADAPKVNKEVR